uniref:Uncharacterized protein n=1 Tax=Arundo donax TaxID=35708 RepID=A0A0A9SVZ6_ARUDO
MFQWYCWMFHPIILTTANYGAVEKCIPLDVLTRGKVVASELSMTTNFIRKLAMVTWVA